MEPGHPISLHGSAYIRLNSMFLRC